jgi:cellulose synthase/poly-beta-1,6-N-acetylglucosamine synthase-like glycosyltransferase
MNIDLIDNKGQRGKTQSLNLALQHADGEVIVVSDADCFWSPQALLNGIEFLSDPSVGAVTGLELLLNPKETWVTETEILYNDVVHTMRIGESKFYSTIIFQGGFGAYKKPLIEQFDVEADDSGTALSIVQKGERTLLVPEVTYFTMSPRTLKGKVTTKLRRASNLVRIWLRCLNLFVRAKIVLPKRIFLPEAYLHIFNPFVFLLLVAVTFLVLFEIPLFSLLLVAFLVVALLFGKLRTMTVELIQDQLFLLGAIFSLTLKQETRLWTTEEAPRDLLKRETLEAKGLV